MNRYRLTWALTVLGVAIAGCGDSGDGPSQARSPSGGGSTKSDPAATVAEFMEAVRRGDEVKAGAMLTPLAREKTGEAGWAVAPAASDTAKFTVGEVEMVADGAAHVECALTDLDESGQPQTSKVIWVLRLEKQGWRVAGMATKVFEDQPPVILNFENPEDMQRKQRLVDEEMVRRAEAKTSKKPTKQR